MQWCPYCERTYDESEYTHCPWCRNMIYKLTIKPVLLSVSTGFSLTVKTKRRH